MEPKQIAHFILKQEVQRSGGVLAIPRVRAALKIITTEHTEIAQRSPRMI